MTRSATRCEGARDADRGVGGVSGDAAGLTTSLEARLREALARAEALDAALAEALDAARRMTGGRAA